MRDSEEMRRLQNLFEAAEDEHSPDQEAVDADMAREQAKEKKLIEILTHLKLTPEKRGIYFQDAGHVHVTLEDEPYGYDLKSINALVEHGIASQVSVAGNHEGRVVLLLTLKN